MGWQWPRNIMGVLLSLIVGWGTIAGAGEEQPVSPPSAHSRQDSAGDTLMITLAEHDRKVAQELRQIKREIAALGQQMAEPGLREIMAGIGYILGLFGVAAFVAARKKGTVERKD
jgi:nickel transport protein